MATEQFANYAQTTLAANVLTADTTITVAPTTSGFPPIQFRIVIDSEIMVVTNVSGTTWTVSRGTSVDGTAATTHSSGAVVTQVLTAAVMTAIESAVAGPMFAQGRLTLTTGTPVTASDVSGTSATTLYYTPYKGALISLYNSSNQWQHFLFTETSLSISSLPTGKVYDVFGSISGGSLALAVVQWASDLSRTALARQDGVWVQSGVPTQRYLGSFRTLAAGQTEDSVLRRWLWNNDNRVMRPLRFTDSSVNWTWSGTWRQDHGNTAAQVDAVLGQVEDAVFIRHSMGMLANNGGSTVLFGIGRNGTSPLGNANGGVCGNTTGNYMFNPVTVVDLGYTAGRNYWTALELSQTNVTSNTILNGLLAETLGGLDGWVLG